MRVVLLGAGHIGRTIARLLAESGDYRVTLVDKNEAALDGLASDGISTVAADTA